MTTAWLHQPPKPLPSICSPYPQKPSPDPQIPIGRASRSAEHKRPAVSSPEGCPTPADRVRASRPATADVRQPLTITERTPPSLQASRRSRAREPAERSRCSGSQKRVQRSSGCQISSCLQSGFSLPWPGKLRRLRRLSACICCAGLSTRAGRKMKNPQRARKTGMSRVERRSKESRNKSKRMACCASAPLPFQGDGRPICDETGDKEDSSLART